VAAAVQRGSNVECQHPALRYTLSIFTCHQALTQTAPSGFRMPTIEELRSLVYCSKTGAIGLYEGFPVYCRSMYDGDLLNTDFQRSTIVYEAFPPTIRIVPPRSVPSIRVSSPYALRTLPGY